MAFDRNFVNVLLLGFGFFLLFTAFQTISYIQKIVLDSIASEDPNFHGDGYVSLAILYGFVAVSNWLAPSALTLCGPRGGMFIGSLAYIVFMVSFLWPQTWLLYAASALLGMGAALIWTSQGTYLTRCSDASTIARNSGVFWAILQANAFVGNVFVYFQFQDKTHIDLATRQMTFGVLISIAVVGVIIIGLLRPPRPMSGTPITKTTSESIETSSTTAEFADQQTGLLKAFVAAVRLFATQKMLLLSVLFLYCGLEMSFYSSIYPSSVGFTLAFGDIAKQLVGLCGICIGIGEVCGGVLFGLLGSSRRFGRDMIVLLGMTVHLIAFVMVYINLPGDSPLGDTADVSVLTTPSVSLALVCAMMLGFGDACFITQIYSTLGSVFAKQSPAAFAIFSFMQSMAAASSFAFSSHVNLTAALLILTVFGLTAAACYCYVEWLNRKQTQTVETVD